MDSTNNWSRLPSFFTLTPGERRRLLATLPLAVGEEDFRLLDQGLATDCADSMSENVLGSFSLPFSVACNFVIDQKPALVPMVTEEPSIVAACSKMAKMVSLGGGFFTEIAPALIRGQIQFYDVSDVDKAVSQFHAHRQEIMQFAQTLCPSMVKRGGGVVAVEIKVLPSRIGPMVVVEPVINVVDAMGANMVNSLLEALAPKLTALIDGQLGLRILSNLCDQRLAKAHCVIPFKALASDPSLDNGRMVAYQLRAAHVFAEADRYRAVTHNKGLLNGIHALATATGNDTRAIEAAAHAYAARDGYSPLTSLDIDEQRGGVRAELTIPLAVGVVGGITAIHPGVRLAHKILGPWAQSGSGLSSVMVSVGLAQCLAALFALCQEGIQKGHMKLHHKKLACGRMSSSTNF